MINDVPYNATVPPPPTEIPEWVWSKRFDSVPRNQRSSKVIEIKIEEFYYPSIEVALKAAKKAVRRKSGMYFGAMNDGRGFNVYLNGKVVQRHLLRA